MATASVTPSPRVTFHICATVDGQTRLLCGRQNSLYSISIDSVDSFNSSDLCPACLAELKGKKRATRSWWP